MSSDLSAGVFLLNYLWTWNQNTHAQSTGFVRNNKKMTLVHMALEILVQTCLLI